MVLAEHDQVVDNLATRGAHPSFGEPVLPWQPRRNSELRQTEVVDAAIERRAEDLVAATARVLGHAACTCRGMRTILLACSLATAACASGSQPVARSASIGNPSIQRASVTTPAESGLPDDATASAATTSAETTGTDPSRDATGGRAPDDGEVVGLSDAQAVAVVQTANHWEIEQAHQALLNGKSARVKQLAQVIIADASAGDERLSRLDDRDGITPRTSPVAERVRLRWGQNLSRLSSATGADFDRLYVGTQVNEYTEVLSILDDTLLPHVQDADLIADLHGVRVKVASHLKAAQAIETALPGSQ
jgi:putative membrane protein